MALVKPGFALSPQWGGFGGSLLLPRVPGFGPCPGLVERGQGARWRRCAAINPAERRVSKFLPSIARLTWKPALGLPCRYGAQTWDGGPPHYSWGIHSYIWHFAVTSRRSRCPSAGHVVPEGDTCQGRNTQARASSCQREVCQRMSRARAPFFF